MITTESAPIGRLAVRGYLATMARVPVAMAAGAIGLVVLSHQLPPGQFALYAWLAVAAPLIYRMLTWPLVSMLVARPEEPSDSQLGAIWSVALGSGPVLGAGAVAAHLLGAPLVPALCVAAYVSVLPLAAPTMIVLTRQLRLGRVALIETVDRVVFHLACVVLVIFGVTTLGPALALLLTAAAVVALALALCAWRPVIRSPRALSPLMRELGSWQGTQVAGAALEIAPVPLIGLAAGAEQAGLLGWAAGIAFIATGVTAAAMGVLLGIFSRLDRDDFSDPALRCSRLVGRVGVGLASVAAAVTPALVGPIFPEVWKEALPVLLLLCAGAAAQTAVAGLTVAWVTRSDVAGYARWQALVAAVSLVGGAAAGLHWGAIGFSAAYALGQMVLAARVLVETRRRFGVSFRADLVLMAIAALVTVGLSAAALSVWSPACLIVAPVAFVGALMALDGPRTVDDLREASRLARASRTPGEIPPAGIAGSAGSAP